MQKLQAFLRLLCVWALLLMPQLASAHAPVRPETRVRDFEVASAACVQLSVLANSSGHQENVDASTAEAVGYPHATKGAASLIPQIAKGSNREMLGQTVGHLRGMSGSAAQKADAFQSMASQITKLSSGSWTAVRGVGTGGSHVFLGGAGEALVINSSGQLFRGSLQGGGVGLAGVGKYTVDFAKMTGL